MALPQSQRTVRPSFSLEGSLDVSRILRAAGVLAATYLCLHIPGPDKLSPFSHSICDREAHSSEAVKTPSSPSCAGRQLKFWGAYTVGFQYAAAASPQRGGHPPDPSASPRVRYRTLMMNEVVANLAGVPVELLVKDVWNQLFHKKGRKYWVDLLFWIKGSLMYKDARKVAIMIVRELQTYLYDEAPVNDAAWKTTRRLLEEHLREWWISCPEDPYRALSAGVWKSLIKVYVDFLEPSLRGSQRLKELDEVLFDPELKVIRSWTDAAHVNIARGKEDEIIPKLDSLARERPREKKTTAHDLPLPASVEPAEQVPAPENEQVVDLDMKSVKRTSRSKKTRVRTSKKRSTKSKET